MIKETRVVTLGFKIFAAAEATPNASEHSKAKFLCSFVVSVPIFFDSDELFDQLFGGLGIFDTTLDSLSILSLDVPRCMNAEACANSHNIGFSSFFDSSEEKPSLNFRQPAQCFVDMARRTHRTPARNEKAEPGHHFRSQNRLRGPSGRHGRAKKRPLRAIKSARSTSGVSAKFFGGCERGKRREKERMLGEVESEGCQGPGPPYRNLRMD